MRYFKGKAGSRPRCALQADVVARRVLLHVWPCGRKALKAAQMRDKCFAKFVHVARDRLADHVGSGATRA